MSRASSSFLALLLSLSATCVLKAADGPFTIDQAMSTPFASAPIVSPSGTKVAWLENESGKRGIWIASAPDWHGKRITNFNDDDGQEIADLVWAPNSAYLLFARGGDFENGGDNPNPDLNPTKPEQNIWYVSVDGSVQKKLTEGRAPAISPRGDLVVFLRGGHVFAMPPDGGDAKNIISQQGAEEDLQWSPDGSELAFTSARKGHAFIGIYSLADKSLRYLDASVDQDMSPVWSPDGTRIAYLRLPVGGPRFGPGPRRTGTPWSIRIADVRAEMRARHSLPAKGKAACSME